MTSVTQNTLYVTSDGAWLEKENDTIVVRVEREKKLQVPLLHLSSIVCLGRSSASAPLMAACADAGIMIAFFSAEGRFLARVDGLPGGSVALRRAQFRAADDAAARLAVARAFVMGKLVNSRRFVMQARRDAADDRKGPLGEVVDRLQVLARRAEGADRMDELRGIEGSGAREYFASLSLLIKRQEDAFRFDGRSRRPPRDPLNALLSFGYALLMTDCAGALAGVGLDPAVGFLHEDRPGRLSLALDLMEEFRVPVVDRLVVALVNREQVRPGDFQTGEAGDVRLTDDARRRFLVAFQEAKRETVHHELLSQELAWGRLPHVQAQLLGRSLRGELDAYPPFVIRG